MPALLVSPWHSLLSAAVHFRQGHFRENESENAVCGPHFAPFAASLKPLDFLAAFAVDELSME